MKGLGAGLRVGVLVLLVAVLGFWFWKSVSERAAGVGGYHVWGKFRNAAGLSSKSRVVIAGLTIGEIADRKLEGRHARVTLRVRRGTELWSNAVLYKKSSSLLGEFYLEIDPGMPQTVRADGTVVQNRLLEPGDEIPTVVEATTTDELMRQMSETLPHVNEVLVEVRGLAADMRALVNGPVANMAYTLDATIQRDAALIDSILQRTDRTLAIVESIARDVKRVTGNADDRVDRIFDNVEAASTDLKALAAEARRELAETATVFREKLDRIDDSLESFDATLRHSASIARKIDDDEGTLGRLVNDPTIADNVADITTSAKGFTDTLFGLQTIVGIRTEYNYYSESWKSYLAIELETRPEKFYLVEVVADPQGRRVAREVLVRDPAGPGFDREVVVENRFRFTFQFGRRIDWLTLRLGIKESTGGVGVDGDFLGGKLRISADVFDASFDDYPRLKVLAAYHFFKYMYVYGGIDDAFNAPGSIPIVNPGITGGEKTTYTFGRDYFGGLMLRFNDSDLSALLFVLGSAVSGAL